MTQIRDMLGVLIIVSVAFSIFANQVMLNELAGDARAVLTFADHISMSVDLFFYIFIQIFTTALVSGILWLLIQLVLRGFGLLIEGIRRATSKLQFPRSSGPKLLQGTGWDEFVDGRGILSDISGTARSVEFKVKLSKLLGNRLMAVVSIALALFSFNDAIRETAHSHISNVWRSPAVGSGALLFSGALMFLFIYSFRTSLWARVELFVDGATIDNPDLEKRFNPASLARIDAQFEQFLRATRGRWARETLFAFLIIFMPFAAYIHGLSLANAYYLRILSSAAATSTDTNEMLDGTAVIRVIDQGVLMIDRNALDLIFVNDENTISVRYRLKQGGIDEIQKRPSCPLLVADPSIRNVLLALYVLDNAPLIKDFYKLSPCPSLSAFAEKERTRSSKPN